MEQELSEIKMRALADIETAKTQDGLYKIQVKYLGRSGELTLIMRSLKDLPGEKKPEAGKMCNQTKTALEQAFAKKSEELAAAEIESKLKGEWIDVTAPADVMVAVPYKPGHIHPVSQVQYDVEQIFSDMGFSIMDGPEIESEYYNFEGLNIPEYHPARDMQDTFFIKMAGDGEQTAGNEKQTEIKKNLRAKHGRLVLRTHTSPVQVRTMERYGAPLRVIVPGRTFRNEATDARHEHTFSQVEGLLVDEGISLAHLKGVMQEFLTRLFGRRIKIRFRPGYFPFVEPGLELDISCLLCNETGCRVCKHTGWLEFMGCGMVHPNVLRSGKIDPGKYQGWAFGFGLTRLAMMKYGINDIRLFSGGDLRFSEQF